MFPALEVARVAREKGWEVRYLGSERGQERAACAEVGVPFRAFQSGPVHRRPTPRAVASLWSLWRCVRLASEDLESDRPDFALSTGGYSSAPVVEACRRLAIPLILHEQNTVPGRTNRIAGRWARAVCTVFDEAAQHFDEKKVRRTGMPVRRELRCGAQGRLPESHSLNGSEPIVLVFGGSQGAAAINEATMATALRMRNRPIHWLHVCGPNNFDNAARSLKRLGISENYTLRPYLGADDMASALFTSGLCVCRAGTGTLAELAAFRRPSVLVPLPNSFADHQTSNARVFERIGAAQIVPQSDLQPAMLESTIEGWLDDENRKKRAAEALKEWDVPDSALKIIETLEDLA